MAMGRNFENIVYRLCILTGKTLKLALKPNTSTIDGHISAILNA